MRIKKILAMIMTCLFLTGCGISFADRPINPPRCIISGFVHLSLYGTVEDGRINGWAGSNYINWYVNNNYTTGWLKGAFVNLRLNDYDNMITISGLINRTFINWTGYNGQWNFYEQCIPE